MLHRTGKKLVTKLAFPFAGCLAQAEWFCWELVPFAVPLPGPAPVVPRSPTSPTPAETSKASEFAGSGPAGSTPVSTPHMEQVFWGVLQPLWAQRGWAGGEHTWGCAAQPAAPPHWGLASAHPNTGIQQGPWSYKPHNPQALLQSLTSDHLHLATWFSGGSGSAGLVVGLNDLKCLFQP